jgi:hypothetical protein
MGEGVERTDGQTEVLVHTGGRLGASYMNVTLNRKKPTPRVCTMGFSVDSTWQVVVETYRLTIQSHKFLSLKVIWVCCHPFVPCLLGNHVQMSATRASVE